MVFEAGAFVGNCRLVRQLGVGGMGTVWEAVCPDGKKVAVKSGILSTDDAKRRFAREVRAMQKMSHPNVVRILSADLDHDPPFFVMPYSECCAQPSAASSKANTLKIFLAICEGVSALHQAGVVHRDIKPDNTRLFDGVPAITDLGLAKFAVRDSTVLTATRAVVGTEIYLAPEQRLPTGSREADERTDVFQLGRTLYQFLTGTHPVLMDLSTMDPFLRSIIERATRERPEDRYQSVVQLIDALKGYLASIDPDNNPVPKLNGILSLIKESARFGQYETAQLRSAVELLLNPILLDSREIWLTHFDELPIEVLNILPTVARADHIEQLMECYAEVVVASVREWPFEYAERVAKRVEAIVSSPASSPRTVANALRALLIAAVRLNRFAAMNKFNTLLVSIRDLERATAVADMLFEAQGDYRQLADQLSPAQLHPALRAARSAVANI